MDNLLLVKSENFNQVQCDFYQNEKNDIVMTREQIGQALEYENPKDAIAKIHRRHKERLDKFSGVDKVTTPGGTQNIVYYSMKGVYEICRWSRQSKADTFMDWVWNVVEDIRKTGVYVPENHAVKQYLSMSEEDRAILYFKQIKEKKELERQKALLSPKANMFDTFMNADNAQTVSKVAKSLGTGRNKLYSLLRERKLLMTNNLPYQKYIDNGYFIVKQVPIQIGKTTIDKPQTYITPKGITYIVKIIGKEEAAVVC